MRIKLLSLAALLATGACVPKRVDEEPLLVKGQQQGDVVRAPDATVGAARAAAVEYTAQTSGSRDSIASVALADCAPAICASIVRGEVSLGMTQAQVMAATRTTSGAWSVREAGHATVLAPRTLEALPRDAAGAITMVQLRDHLVTSYSYRDQTGIRIVASPSDTTSDGRTRALVAALVREGDDLAAAGDLKAALNRYDRASVLVQDPMIEYRIASILDKELRPVEALVRYQRFLHEMELEKIKAYGDAYAKQADAIARARERVMVIEKQTSKDEK